jgi:hypothetical protein
VEFISVGQSANGFIALGQEAVGVIAIGQVATGVIAIGQGARGVVAVGMLSCGIVSVGMLSFGLVGCVAMIGAGGRGVGGVLPLCPQLPPRPQLPAQTPRQDLEGGRAQGWIAVEVQQTPTGFALIEGGRALAAKLAPSMINACAQALAAGQRVLAFVKPASGGPEVSRLMRMPKWNLLSPAWLGQSAAQLLGLAVLSALYFWVGFAPVVDEVISLIKD